MPHPNDPSSNWGHPATNGRCLRESLSKTVREENGRTLQYSQLRTRPFFLFSENFVKLRWIPIMYTFRMRAVICDIPQNRETCKHTKSYLKETQCRLFCCTAEAVSNCNAYRLEHNWPLQPFFSDEFIFKFRNVFTHINHDFLDINSSYLWRDSTHAHFGVHKFLPTCSLTNPYVSLQNTWQQNTRILRTPC
jgi:hypothetical protein